MSRKDDIRKLAAEMADHLPPVRSEADLRELIKELHKFRLSILTELQARGVKEIFIASVDSLSGFPEAINIVYPLTMVHHASCI